MAYGDAQTAVQVVWVVAVVVGMAQTAQTVHLEVMVDMVVAVAAPRMVMSLAQEIGAAAVAVCRVVAVALVAVLHQFQFGVTPALQAPLLLQTEALAAEVC